jgi:hypothetical protein
MPSCVCGSWADGPVWYEAAPLALKKDESARQPGSNQGVKLVSGPISYARAASPKMWVVIRALREAPHLLVTVPQDSTASPLFVSYRISGACESVRTLRSLRRNRRVRWAMSEAAGERFGNFGAGLQSALRWRSVVLQWPWISRRLGASLWPRGAGDGVDHY